MDTMEIDRARREGGPANNAAKAALEQQLQVLENAAARLIEAIAGLCEEHALRQTDSESELDLRANM